MDEATVIEPTGLWTTKLPQAFLDMNILVFRGQKLGKGPVVGYRLTSVSLVLECERIDCMGAFQTYQPISYS